MASVPLVAGGVLSIVCLLGVSAFFSSSEIAIFSLSETDVATLDAAADSRVEGLQHLRGDSHRLLVTLLVGNNVVNLAIGSLSTVLVLEFLPSGIAIGVATVLGSGVVLVFGEIVPKSYGLGHATSWSLTVAGPIRRVEWLLGPIVTVFEWITGRINGLVDGDPDIEAPYFDGE